MEKTLELKLHLQEQIYRSWKNVLKPALNRAQAYLPVNARSWENKTQRLQTLKAIMGRHQGDEGSQRTFSLPLA